MNLDQLIGMQLVAASESEIVVSKDGKEYTIRIDDSDYGGCCGFNEVSAILHVDKTDKTNNPIIVDVKIYKNEQDEGGEVCKLTLFGAYKPLYELDTLSWSGSGWGYGANVKLLCDPLSIKEILTEW